jgi:small nuclear ribonucleoprotein (snRNP)-like protein
MKCSEVSDCEQQLSEREDTDSQQIDVNFESQSFDAKSALLNDNIEVTVPVSDAPIFNNIEEYKRKTLSKTNAIKLLESKNKSKTEDKLMVRSTKLVETLTAPKPAKQLSTVLTRMRQQKGPLDVLYRAINNRIKVLIRRRKRCEIFDGRFGWIKGLLIAFDKHYNLVLTDVDETHNIIKSNQNIEICNHIRQLFVRGDNEVQQREDNYVH